MSNDVSIPRSACGVVIIGRNEGERLRRCLDSVRPIRSSVVYVDSGSTDGSVEMARANGVDVVGLDMTIPFTAARARNAGFGQLRKNAPELPYVQFVDGDCELVEGWVETAIAFLEQGADVACICGRLRERFPERSLYNRLCDYEWDRPPGETAACGGVVMIRSVAFASIGGFREDLVAGEEPELCQRLRHQGWKIWRLARDMAWHDAAMLRFGQWWTRSKRVGFAYAQSVWIHRGASERAEWAQLLRPWVWAVIVPLVTLVGCSVWGWPAALMFLVYPVQVIRYAAATRGRWSARLERGAFLMLGKLPEWLGQCRFWLRAQRGASSAANFDYKV